MQISPSTRRLSEALSSRDAGTDAWPWDALESLTGESTPTDTDVTEVDETTQSDREPGREFGAPLRVIAGSLALGVAGTLVSVPAFADSGKREETVVVSGNPSDKNEPRILKSESPGDAEETKEKVAQKVGELSEKARKYGSRLADKVKDNTDEQTDKSDRSRANESDQLIDKDELNRTLHSKDTTKVPGGHFDSAEAGGEDKGKEQGKATGKDAVTTRQNNATGTEQPAPDPKPKVLPLPSQLPTANPSAQPAQKPVKQGTKQPAERQTPAERQNSAKETGAAAKGSEKATFPDRYNPKPVDFNGTQVAFPVNAKPADIIKHPKAWDYRTAKNYHLDEPGGGKFLAADIQAASGTAIITPVNGTVRHVQDDGRNPHGSVVEVLSDNGKHVFVLTHLARGVQAKPGMVVKLGESQLGVLNDYGPKNKNDSHLHIEVKDAQTGKRLNVQELMRDAFAAQKEVPAAQVQPDQDKPVAIARQANPALAAQIGKILKNKIPDNHFPSAEGATIEGESPTETQPGDSQAAEGQDNASDLSRVRDILKNAKPGHTQPRDPDDLSRVRDILKDAKPGQSKGQEPEKTQDKTPPGQDKQAQDPNGQAEEKRDKGNKPEVSSKAADVVTKDVVKRMMPGVRDEVLGVCYPLIMNALEEKGIDTVDMALYAFATVKIETGVTVNGKNMTCAPIEEIGKGHGRYMVNGRNYYGRGYIQLTWDFNYKNYGKRLGVNLYGNPSKALDPKIAARVLAEYLYQNKDRLNHDFKTGNIADARKVVNGGTNGLWSFKKSLNAGKHAMKR